jgi:hypothetical protein
MASFVSWATYRSDGAVREGARIWRIVVVDGVQPSDSAAQSSSH